MTVGVHSAFLPSERVGDDTAIGMIASFDSLPGDPAAAIKPTENTTNMQKP